MLKARLEKWETVPRILKMDKGCEEMIGQALKLRLSALAGFEAALGLDRDAFAGDAYATKQSDPHLTDEAA